MGGAALARFAAVLLALVVALAVPACALRRAAVPAVTAPAGTIDRGRAVVRSMVEKQRIPGLAVTVSQDQSFIWREGYGFADLNARIPATASTQFRVGSVSKLLTATELMWLAQKGRIDLDVPISRYLDVPEALRAITLRQLAGHQGGIRHYRGNEFLHTRRYTRLRDGLAIFSADPPVSAPGAAYLYSSYGYNLIGAALEAKEKLPFSELIRRHVLEPLRMRHTVVDDGGTSRSTRALGYVVGPAEATRAPYDDLSSRWPSGGYLMTTDDMARLGRSVFGPGLLSEESLEVMLTLQSLASGEATGVGIGWRISVDNAGRRFVHHGGSSNGGRAFLRIMRGFERTGVALLLVGCAAFFIQPGFF